MKLFQFIYLIGLSIFSAFVFMKLWGWFVVPFFDLPEITLAYAYAFGLVVGIVIPTKYYKEDELDLELYVQVTLKPVLALFIGWILTFFI